MDDFQFKHVMMKSKMKTQREFYDRYKNHEFYIVKINVNKSGMHTFGVSQFGQRLLPRRASYKYANCIAYLVKAGPNGEFEGCTYITSNVTRQDRDNYLECNIKPGEYFLYIDMEW